MRIIIVGSGPGGLVMGHCFLQAGIDDFVILESRPHPAERSGAGLGLWPHSFRVLDQLGMLDDFKKISTPMSRLVHLNAKGSVISDHNAFDVVAENHGHAFRVFSRNEMVQALYDKLPSKETRVISNKKVKVVEQTESGVSAVCEDGSVFEGDILIGCDGVHSAVRHLAIEGSKPGNQRDKPATAMKLTAEYSCLFGSGPRLDGITPCDITELHDKAVTFQMVATHDRCFWLFHHEKPKGSRVGQRYTAEDSEARADEYADHPVSWGGKLKFKDLWDTRSDGRMYDLEEGVAEKWYNGRVVIAGDAAHKMTPNLAMGCNNAIEDAAALANELYALLKETSTPKLSGIENAFARYQKVREKRVKHCVRATGDYCRRTCWQTWLGGFLLLHVAPLLGPRFAVNNIFSPWVKGAAKLSFVEEKHPTSGVVPWKYA